MTPSSAYLTLQGIGKQFGGFTALEDIDLSIQRGEFVCFLGPSGCGKTTLLRIVAGLEPHSRGTLVQDGRDISRLPPAQRDYGIVFQSYALFPNLSVADNVAYGLVNRRQPRERIDARVAELLALVGLPGSGSKYPAQMSGGQQQRVALARAWAMQPRVLLLDEPTSSLDPHAKREVEQLMGDFAEAGTTLVFASHNLGQVKRLATRVVYLEQGRILADLPVDVFFNGPLGATSREAELFVKGELG